MYNYLECQIYLMFFCFNFFDKEEKMSGLSPGRGSQVARAA
jgi:hypothetical protein